MALFKRRPDCAHVLTCWTTFVALSVGLNTPLWAVDLAKQDAARIEYASPDQSVWTTRTLENGEPANPLKTVAAALFAKAGIPWVATAYPASRLFSNLQNGTVQFSMLVKAPALQACCLFSKKPVTTAEIRAYRRAGTPPIKTREGLVGQQVITIRGYSYGGLAAFLADPQNRITTHDTQAHASAFRMLANGRADYLIDYAGPAAEVLFAEPIEGVAFDVLSRQDVHLVLSKNYPDAARVMQRLEAIAATLDVEALLARAATSDKGMAPARGAAGSQ